MVNFTQVRKVTNDFMREHQKLCSFVLHLMLLAMYSPAFIFGTAIISTQIPSVGFLWLLAALFFLNMVVEDFRTKQIDIRKAVPLIIMLLIVSQYDFLRAVVLFAFYVIALQFFNLALLFTNFIVSDVRIEKFFRPLSKEEEKQKGIDEPVELPFLPILAMATAIYSSMILYFYHIGATEIYVPIMEIHHVTGEFLNRIFSANWRWTLIAQCVIVFLLFCNAYHKMVKNLLQSDFYKGTKMQELQGFIAPWDLALVAAFMVVFNIFNMQFIIGICFSLSVFFNFIYKIYQEIRGDKLWQ